MKRISLIFFLSFILLCIWFGEDRSFYCLDDRRCVTVWKTFNNTCYVIPGKYYGLIKPFSNNYIKTFNIGNMDIIWENGTDTMIVNLDDTSQIINNSSNGIKIINYNRKKSYYNSLYTYFDGKYRRYKKNVDRIGIFIKENYAWDKNGKNL